MDKNQPLLVSAIKNAERALALLKDCHARNNGNNNSTARTRSLARAARDELSDSHAAVVTFLRSLQDPSTRQGGTWVGSRHRSFRYQVIFRY